MVVQLVGQIKIRTSTLGIGGGSISGHDMKVIKINTSVRQHQSLSSFGITTGSIFAIVYFHDCDNLGPNILGPSDNIESSSA